MSNTSSTVKSVEDAAKEHGSNNHPNNSMCRNAATSAFIAGASWQGSQGWISIERELPEKHESSGGLGLSLPVLVYYEEFGAYNFYPEERQRVTMYDHKRGLWRDERGGSHWKPLSKELPSPPIKQAGQE